MGFKYRNPSVKIGGVRIRKNKRGISVSSKTLLGGTKTYNSATGKTTKTYKTGIKGLSYQTVSGGNTSKKYAPNYSNAIQLNDSPLKNFLITFFVGWLGVQKFRQHRFGLGLLYLFTAGIFGFGWLYDVIIAFIKLLNDNNAQNKAL